VFNLDALIVVVLIFLFVFFFKRTFSGVIYAFAITDIFLRLVSFIKHHITASDIIHVLDKYFPENIPAIMAKYTEGILYKILLWVYFGLMCIFLFYIIRTFIRKK